MEIFSDYESYIRWFKANNNGRPFTHEQFYRSLRYKQSSTETGSYQSQAHQKDKERGGNPNKGSDNLEVFDNYEDYLCWCSRNSVKAFKRDEFYRSLRFSRGQKHQSSQDNNQSNRSDVPSSGKLDLEKALTTLGLGPNASFEDVKLAWKHKAAQWHPDKLNNMAPEIQDFATEGFKTISAAYQFLVDSSRG